MNLPVLKYFIVISECKSFTRASEQLFITQPTLSRQIQDLEAEMGVLLLQREGHRLTLTDAGKRFLKEAKEIVRRCDNLKDVVQLEDPQKTDGSIRISFPEYMNTDFLHYLIRSFAEKNPYVELSLARNPYMKLRQNLISGKCDLGFTLKIYIQDLPELAFLSVGKNRLQLVVPKSHPLAGRKTVDIRELANEKFIIMERKVSPLTVDYVIGLCTRAGFSPKSAQYVNDIETALLLVAAGKGIAFLFSTVHVNSENVSVLDVNGNHDALEIVAAYRKKKDNPVIDLFLQDIKEYVPKSPAMD